MRIMTMRKEGAGHRSRTNCKFKRVTALCQVWSEDIPLDPYHRKSIAMFAIVKLCVHTSDGRAMKRVVLNESYSINVTGTMMSSILLLILEDYLRVRT